MVDAPHPAIVAADATMTAVPARAEMAARALMPPRLAGRIDPGSRTVTTMSSPEIASAVLAADRRAGREVRDRVRALPAGHESARLAADAMAPAFQALVLSLLLLPGSRLLAVRAAAAGAAAGLVARVARDAIDRPRPGGRTEGGFPSRHAASSTAIAMVVARQRPVLGAVARMMAVTGMAARVAAADHDPLDVVAGAGLGAAVARVMRRRGRRRSGTRR